MINRTSLHVVLREFCTDTPNKLKPIQRNAGDYTFSTSSNRAAATREMIKLFRQSHPMKFHNCCQ